MRELRFFDACSERDERSPEILMRRQHRLIRFTKFAILILSASALVSPIRVSTVLAEDLKSTIITLGLILPMTGNRSSIGEDTSQGAELALEQLRKYGGAKKGGVRLSIEDSKGDPAQGVSAYRKLLADGVRFIITSNSNVSMAVSPLVGRNKVLQLAICTTSEKYATPNDTTFRTNGSTNPEAQLLAERIAEVLPSHSRVGILSMQDEYPLTLQTYLQRNLQSRGLRTTTEEFVGQERDFRGILSRIKGRDVRAVVFLGYAVQAAIFLKQFRETGPFVKDVFASASNNTRELFDSASKESEGLVIAYPLPNLQHSAAAIFQEKYGREPNFFSANAYDAVILADRALEKCDYQVEIGCLTKALSEIKDYNGLSGKKGFDSVFGDMQDSYSLLVVRDGKFVPLEKR